MDNDQDIGFTPPEHDRPAITVDVVIFALNNNDLHALLVRRQHAPYQEVWALPGGFVQNNESLEDAAARKLAEETGVTAVYTEQLFTFGDIDRDPRMRIVTVAYFALVPYESVAIQVDQAELKGAAKWYSLKSLPDLAFDHKKIVEYAHQRLKYKLEYTSVGFELLPDQFTLTQLQQAYEVVLDEPLDKRNFRRKILAAGVIEETGQKTKEGEGRPAKLYHYVDDSVAEIKSRRLFP
ncbi:MAG: NUDIX domain-containing protein [Anaerolineae bacterium]